MKRFLYCESTEGGINQFAVSGPDGLCDLLGWMCRTCKEADQQLVDWMERAVVGEYTEHRLGLCVRLLDTE